MKKQENEYQNQGKNPVAR